MNLVEEIPNGLFKNAHNFTFEQIWWDARIEERKGLGTAGIFQRLRETEPMRYGESITMSELRGVLDTVYRTGGVIPVEEPGRGYVMGHDPITTIEPSIQDRDSITITSYATEEELINYFDRISQDEEQQTNTEH